MKFKSIVSYGAIKVNYCKEYQGLKLFTRKAFQDISQIYQKASIVKKQELLRLVFGQTLYYQNTSYRTPYLMKIFQSNHLKNNQKTIISTKERGVSSDGNPSFFGGAEEDLNEPFVRLLMLVRAVNEENVLVKSIEYLNFSCKDFVHEKLIMYKISRSLYMIRV